MQSRFLVRDSHKSIQARDVVTFLQGLGFLQLFNSMKIVQCIVALFDVNISQKHSRRR